MIRKPLVLLALLSCLIFHAGCGASRGLWVQCEGRARTLSSRERIDALISRAAALRMNMLFVQVFRRDRTWFASALTDSAPFTGFMEKEGIDPLRYLLVAAHRQGIEVHAWFNVFNLGNNPDASFLQRHGDGFILRDRYENQTGDYMAGVLDTPGGRFMIDTPGLWLDPGQPEVRAYLLDILSELAAGYPDLDGIHLDFIRYPFLLPMLPLSGFTVGNDFGHNEGSLALFEDSRVDKWDDWKRENVTRFVKEAGSLLDRRHPRMRLSAAVICWADRAYLTAFQDWRTWIEKDWVDFVVLMNYSRDGVLFHHVTRQAGVYPEDKVLIGVGLYALKDKPDLLAQELADVRRSKNGGFVLFSYDDLFDDDGICDFLIDAMAE
jgi:uncharacterized lipoprotein YddW (UPF0748 family)